MTTVVPARPGGSPPPQQPPEPASPAQPPPEPGPIVASPAPPVPAGTTSRFLLLIAAVVATSVVTFTWLHLSVPANAAMFQHTVLPCGEQARAAVRQPAVDFADLNNRVIPAVGDEVRCSRPYYLRQAGWIGAGLSLEFLVAGLLYLTHPVRIRRWRRLVPLVDEARAGPGDNRDLRADLDAVAREMGVPAPGWLLDPNAETTGAQAFGLPRRRYVCLDAGLVQRYDRDRPGVLAVARHELAHLANRDIGRTYLTTSVWWAFVAVGLVPFLVLLINPTLLYPDRHWSPTRLGHALPGTGYALASTAILATLVYLTRNAVLRIREAHADIRAAETGAGAGIGAGAGVGVVAGVGAGAGELRRVIAGLPEPAKTRFPRLARLLPLRPHPTPGQRLAALDEPARVLRTGRFELVGVGFAAGITVQNVTLLAENVSLNIHLGVALAALPAGVLLSGVLAAAMWRTVATDPSRSTAGRDAAAAYPAADPGAGRGTDRRGWLATVWATVPWLAMPVALTVGYAAAIPLSLLSAITGAEPVSGRSTLLGLLLFLVSGAMLAAWTLSTAKSVYRAAQTADRTGEPGRPPVADQPVAGELASGRWGARRRFAAGSASGRWAAGRWGMPAVVGTAVLVGAPLFAVGYAALVGDQVVTVLVGALPSSGATIGWYALLAQVAGASLPPLLYLSVNPLVALGLLALWAVPAGCLLAGVVHRRGFRMALRVGAVSGLAVVLAGLVLPVLSRLALPADVRLTPADSEDATVPYFGLVYFNTYLLVAVLGQAVAVAVTVARARRLRLALAVLAASTTAVLAAAGISLTFAVFRCVDASGNAPGCGPPSVFFVSDFVSLHAIQITGLVLAVPAALVGAVVGRLARGPRPGTPTAVRRPTHRRVAVAPTVVLLAALGLVLTAGAVVTSRHDYGYWSPLPATAAAPITRDPCVVGTWTERSRVVDRTVGRLGTLRFTGQGVRQTFSADGVAVVDFGTGSTERASTPSGQVVEYRLTGQLRLRYATGSGLLTYREPTAAGTVTLLLDATVVGTGALGADATPDHYRCDGDSLVEYGDTYVIEMVRG